jgi:RIO-like serine/threonine protein kinase
VAKSDNLPYWRKKRRIDGALELLLWDEDSTKRRTVVSIIQESKLDFKFPCTKSCCENGDEQYRFNLTKFYTGSQTGKKKQVALHNVLVQIRMYLGLYHRRFGLICTINTWTFVMLDSEGKLHVSRTFSADCTPALNQWALLEVILRFIVAGIGNYSSGSRPNDVLAERPVFLRRFFKQTDQSDKDDAWGPWKPSDSSGAASSFTSAAAAASSSTPHGHRKQCMGPMCWADVEDDRRNKEVSGLTWEEQLSVLGTLEGDAQLIGSGRSGGVYRKTFSGVDMVIKLMMFGQRRGKDDPSEASITKELEAEAETYARLTALQGDVVPRFFGLRFLQLGLGLITEFSGIPYSQLQIINSKQMELALHALSKLHNHGILHGDASNLGNVLWNDKLGKAVWIDFGFAVREDHAKVSWSMLTAREVASVKESLRKRLRISPPNASKRRTRKSLRFNSASDIMVENES